LAQAGLPGLLRRSRLEMTGGLLTLTLLTANFTSRGGGGDHKDMIRTNEMAAMPQQLDRFINLLEDIFELKKSDLDFGIYRILNLRNAEISEFLHKELPKQAVDILKNAAGPDKSVIKKKMADLEIEARRFKADPEDSEEYVSLKNLLELSTDMDSLEADTYSHLYNFFSRYYDEGDFISKRRYKEGVYAIPYEGEEIKLYWANHDQYYIKTSENFKGYTFKADGKTVHFRIVDASTEQNNNKENGNAKRCFMLYTPEVSRADKRSEIKAIESNPENTELVIHFVYEIPSDKKNHDTENYDTICKIIAKEFPAWGFLKAAEKDKKTILEKHYKAYVARNTFDYFIHKDLKGFLSRELDFFIKNEVLYLDDITNINTKKTAAWITKAQAVKHIGKVIIDFLAQIEEFQKKLWLKKKFVIRTDWCITLDKIPESFYDEIRKNKVQVQEWIDLYAVDEISNGDMLGFSHEFTNPPKVEFFKEHKNLMVDTKHFSREFTEKIIASIHNLDEETNGVLIHSENFQALNFLHERYKEKIDCIHIDPPYNTDTSGFLYKNNYKHSSWASMMENKIISAFYLLPVDGSFICHIDENEYENLYHVFQNTPLLHTGTVVWDKRNPMTGGKGIATQHEYIIWRSRGIITVSTSTDNAGLMLSKVKELIEKYNGVNDKTRKEYTNWLNEKKEFTGGDMAYRYIDDDGRLYQSVSLRAPEVRTDEKFFTPLIHPITKKPCPVPRNGFSRTPETLKAMIERGEILFGEDEVTQPRQKMYLTKAKNKQLTTVIQDATRGKTDLDKMNLAFPYNHSVGFYKTILENVPGKNDLLFLDFFAGSATTGHAVINLNRGDDGKRKYILVEMGDYFDTVTKPRMRKAVYAEEWKDGKPVSHTSGISQIIKYFRLENYEDTLNNIAFGVSNYKNGDAAAKELFNTDYLVNYMLDTETSGSLLNLERFTSPFDYKLKITQKNETKEETIDLIETFNYLAGISVKRLHLAEGFKAVEGTLPDGSMAVSIWRNISGNVESDNKLLLDYAQKLRMKIDFAALDKVYVNGDNSLVNNRQQNESFEVCLIEAIFKEKMFDV
jgi:adenine-specific DNA-methyltransferase